MQLTVAAKANTTPAHIVKSTKVCGSYIHNVDLVLLPTANVTLSPAVSTGAHLKPTQIGRASCRERVCCKV